MLRSLVGSEMCIRDRFLALHYDAYINGSIGGFADYPEPSTDGATVESQRITKVINEVYFPESGIQYVSLSLIHI